MIMAKKPKLTEAFVEDLFAVLEKHKWAGDEISIKLADSAEIGAETAAPSSRGGRRRRAGGGVPVAEATSDCPPGKVPVFITVRVGAVDKIVKVCR
jgi:hypothetical protein